MLPRGCHPRPRTFKQGGNVFFIFKLGQESHIIYLSRLKLELSRRSANRNLLHFSLYLNKIISLFYFIFIFSCFVNVFQGIGLQGNSEISRAGPNGHCMHLAWSRILRMVLIVAMRELLQ